MVQNVFMAVKLASSKIIHSCYTIPENLHHLDIIHSCHTTGRNVRPSAAGPVYSKSDFKLTQ